MKARSSPRSAVAWPVSWRARSAMRPGPFSDYCIQDRPTILEMHEEYQNEKFDIVLSNPPFSLKLTPDEKKSVEKAFSGELKISEDLFIERWYQLLRAGFFRSG